MLMGSSADSATSLYYVVCVRVQSMHAYMYRPENLFAFNKLCASESLRCACLLLCVRLPYGGLDCELNTKCICNHSVCLAFV